MGTIETKSKLNTFMYASTSLNAAGHVMRKTPARPCKTCWCAVMILSFTMAPEITRCDISFGVSR